MILDTTFSHFITNENNGDDFYFYHHNNNSSTNTSNNNTIVIIVIYMIIRLCISNDDWLTKKRPQFEPNLQPAATQTTNLVGPNS